MVDVEALETAIENHESDPDDHPQLRNAIKAVAQKFADLEVDLDRIEGAIPTDTYINTLIDAKLGVIENGTY
jgi:hypothetical protein